MYRAMSGPTYEYAHNTGRGTIEVDARALLRGPQDHERTARGGEEGSKEGRYSTSAHGGVARDQHVGRRTESLRVDKAGKEVHGPQVRKVLVELLSAAQPERVSSTRVERTALRRSANHGGSGQSGRGRESRDSTTAIASPSAESCFACPSTRPSIHLSRCCGPSSSRFPTSGSGPFSPAGAHTETHVSLSVPDDARRYARPNRDRVCTAKCASCDGVEDVGMYLPFGGPPGQLAGGERDVFRYV